MVPAPERKNAGRPSTPDRAEDYLQEQFEASSVNIEEREERELLL